MASSVLHVVGYDVKLPPAPEGGRREEGQRVLALKMSEATRCPRGWQLPCGYEIQISRDAMIPLPKVIGREAGQRVLALKASEATRRPRGWQLLFGYEIQMTVEMR